MEELTVRFGAGAVFYGAIADFWVEVPAFTAFLASSLEISPLYVFKAEIRMVKFTVSALSSMFTSILEIVAAVWSILLLS